MRRPIYILAGQSNAVGMKQEFMRLTSNLRPDDSYYAQMFAWNGSSLTHPQKDNNWVPGSPYREQMIQEIISILKSDPDAYLSDIIWVQGEGDTYKNTAVNYADDLKNLVNEILSRAKTALPEREEDFADFKFHVVLLSDHAEQAQGRPHWETVQEQQILAAKTHPNIEIIDTDEVLKDGDFSSNSYFSDGIHYTGEVQWFFMENILEHLFGYELHKRTQTVEAEDGTWVKTTRDDVNSQYVVRDDFECAGIDAGAAKGGADAIEFKDSSLNDWKVSEHRDVDGRLVFQSKNGDQLLFIDDAKKIEFWEFEDDEMYSEEEFFDELGL